RSMPVARDARISKGTCQDRVVLSGDHLQGTVRQTDAFLQVLLCAPVKLCELKTEMVGVGDSFKNTDRLTRYLNADAVTWNYGNPLHKRAATKKQKSAASFASCRPTLSGLRSSAGSGELRRPQS